MAVMANSKRLIIVLIGLAESGVYPCNRLCSTSHRCDFNQHETSTTFDAPVFTPPVVAMPDLLTASGIGAKASRVAVIFTTPGCLFIDIEQIPIMLLPAVVCGAFAVIRF
jgi:hypothetical protein